ncbi:STAS domain-containing protein [Phytohabitans sp. ZYX-F-186]|uniref:STAS domain-containing protein n=1 Tax=Phytohabitans maris TaxID=3071409 RepID=A0ABU0ZBJ2_9ACTN|nr:STAS domain-containing protein [Phytohabitans sp. ZYX-F-186]MDQ7904436.1 STAS domain-containing protein [Phytohabitans sp. ZYX-F-186]
MTQLTTTVRIGPGHVQLALVGEIDLSSVEVLLQGQGEALAGAASRSLPGVVVDLGRVTFLDSTGIGALVGGFREASAAGLTYRLENPRGAVARVLDVSGVLPTLAPRPQPA